MIVTFLGHAGFCVETDDATILMDPWLSPSGAFDSSWFQFPRNHHLAALAEQKLQRPVPHKFVYISHEHQDHFDQGFLDSLRTRDFSLLVPRYRRPELRRLLRDYRCRDLIAVEDGQRIPLDDGYISVFLDDSELNRDSAILVKAGGAAFLNLNDCRIFDRIDEIVATEGRIDAFTCQFSGASWHPTCYEYSDEDFARISDRKVRSKYSAVAHALKICQPKVFLPSAGPPCFLDPQLLDLNFRMVSIFRHAPDLANYLRPILEETGTELPNAMPGDVFDVKTGAVLFEAADRVEDGELETYVRSYAKSYEGFFASRAEEHRRIDPVAVRQQLRLELERKLRLLTLRERVGIPLYFGLTEMADQPLRIDFERGIVEDYEGAAAPPYYRIETPAWQIAKVLDKSITWEEFGLAFRVRLVRLPDVYQPLIHAFLTMDPADLVHFCRMIVELESRDERIEVEADGRTYSVLRWCPHNGGDLLRGWVEDDRYLVCPRHKWHFDLAREGVCTTNDSSVRACVAETDVASRGVA